MNELQNAMAPRIAELNELLSQCRDLDQFCECLDTLMEQGPNHETVERIRAILERSEEAGHA